MLRHLSGRGELVVQSGAVWITLDGDPEDDVLQAGDRLAIGPPDTVLVQSWRRGEPTVEAWRAFDGARMSAIMCRLPASFAPAVSPGLAVQKSEPC